MHGLDIIREPAVKMIKGAMCGIVAIVGKEPVTHRILRSLKLLEYRGYDSAGVAVVSNGEVLLRKSINKIESLEEDLAKAPIDGDMGIGHTRWATHGEPEIRNAHPFKAGNIALVHNGIIENYLEIKDRLLKQGLEFESDTDTEVMLKLIYSYHSNGLGPYEAVFEAFHDLKGAFAVAVLFGGNDNVLIGMRKGAPMAVGVGEDEMYLASDALALSPLTNKVLYLDDGEIVELHNKGYKITNHLGEVVERAPKKVILDYGNADKSGHEHFMLKEIMEQPEVAARVFNEYYDRHSQAFMFDKVGLHLKGCNRLYIVACGTSYHAACVAKYWFERLARIPVEVDIASEFRYRHPPLDKAGVGMVISQSGETADTLAALRHMKDCGLKTVAMVNVEESTIARESNYVLPIYAGFEIGVASTKAFTAQLVVLALMCLHTAYEKDLIGAGKLHDYLSHLHSAPDLINEVFTMTNEIMDIAKELTTAKSMLYVGRAAAYPIALEGALKIKEISYIHAEGIAAGELKHGTIALIDKHMPVIVVAPSDSVLTKTVSNIQEINARHGKMFTITDANGAKELGGIDMHIIKAPDCDEIVSAIVYNIILQLLAYHTALALGRDVDQPRNLAKSVTVE